VGRILITTVAVVLDRENAVEHAHQLGNTEAHDAALDLRVEVRRVLVRGVVHLDGRSHARVAVARRRRRGVESGRSAVPRAAQRRRRPGRLRRRRRRHRLRHRHLATILFLARKDL
jgi:hypothetical protein